MRFVHCADLHIGSGGAATGAACLHHMAERTIAAAADTLLIAGDLFDRAARPDQAVQAVLPALELLQSADIPVYCVDGNHDICDARSACLFSLHQRGLIHLLRPRQDAAGEPHIAAYDGAQGCVTYVDGVRIVGLGFLQDSTRRRLRALLSELAPYPGFTVCMLHTGIYDTQPLPIGGLCPQDIAGYRGLVDYFALGHRHGREEHLHGFNPGALCGVRMNDPREPRGYYMVDVYGKLLSATFVAVDWV